MLINNQHYKKIPEILFYQKPNTYDYLMLNMKKGTVVGEMSVVPRRDLYISGLKIKNSERGKGLGHKFLDFAKHLSYKFGSEGRLNVLASLFGNEQVPPHIFYRKYGFSSLDKDCLSTIDEYISQGKNLPKYFPPLRMQYRKKT